MLKKLWTGCWHALLALVLVIGLLLGYAAFAERSASRKADDFCQAVLPGSTTSRLLDSATAHGADTRQTRWYTAQGQDHLPVTFTGFTPLSRHICFVTAAQGRVVSGRLVYLD
jgi:hypothetical protein